MASFESRTSHLPERGVIISWILLVKTPGLVQELRRRLIKLANDSSHPREHLVYFKIYKPNGAQDNRIDNVPRNRQGSGKSEQPCVEKMPCKAVSEATWEIFITIPP